LGAAQAAHDRDSGDGEESDDADDGEKFNEGECAAAEGARFV